MTPIHRIALLLPLLLAACVTTPTGGAASTPSSPTAPAPSVRVGDSAPDFALPAHDRSTIRLADLRGFWIVLHFHRDRDLPDCACQAVPHTLVLESFRDMGGLVLGVSDTDVDRLAFVHSKYNLETYLLSDPDRSVIHRYGAWDESEDPAGRRGRIARLTLLIDPTGRVVERWADYDPVEFDDRVRAAIAGRASTPPHASK